MEALKASIDQNKPKPNKGKTTSKKTKELIAK